MSATIEAYRAIRVIYESADFLIVDKPSGLLVHASKPSHVWTLADWVISTGRAKSAHIINRLDRETSGLVLLARHEKSAGELGKTMIGQRMSKEYLAMVVGDGELPERGEVDLPLLRKPMKEEGDVWLKQEVVDTPEARSHRPALTTYVVLARRQMAEGNLSLVRAFPQTGRLHQIRVHLAHLGYPVVGDKLYGKHPEAYLEFARHGLTPEWEHKLGMARHALHASALSFEYQRRGYRFESSLPHDMKNYWEKTGQKEEAVRGTSAPRGNVLS